jgi:hypothetical protein
MSRKSAKRGKSKMSVTVLPSLKTRRAQALASVMVFALAAIIVIALREASQPNAPTSDAEPQAASVLQDAAGSGAATGSPAPRAATRASAAPSNTPASAAVDPRSETTRAGSTAPASAEERVDAITITGCLERTDNKFRLKDTEGENAPRSRSWKTGFLTRRNRSVDVVDALNRFKLANHVGERVSATGMLVDGDMQIRSLHRVANSCEKEV